VVSDALKQLDRYAPVRDTAGGTVLVLSGPFIVGSDDWDGDLAVGWNLRRDQAGAHNYLDMTTGRSRRLYPEDEPIAEKDDGYETADGSMVVRGMEAGDVKYLKGTFPEVEGTLSLMAIWEKYGKERWT